MEEKTYRKERYHFGKPVAASRGLGAQTLPSLIVDFRVDVANRLTLSIPVCMTPHITTVHRLDTPCLEYYPFADRNTSPEA